VGLRIKPGGTARYQGSFRAGRVEQTAMDEMPSGGSAGTAPREERRKTIRTKQARDSRDFRVRGVERSAKGEVSSDSSTGTVQREERRKTIRTEQSAKPGAVFGQHGRSEPPKPESAVRSQDVMSGSKSGDRGVGGNTGSPIAFGGLSRAYAWLFVARIVPCPARPSTVEHEGLVVMPGLSRHPRCRIARSRSFLSRVFRPVDPGTRPG